MNAIKNFFRQIRALWCLPGLVAVIADRARTENVSKLADLQNQIVALRTHLDTQLTAMANNHAVHAEQTHKRLTAAIQSAAHETLYEAQLVRHLVCGTCQKKYGARVRWTEDGTLICPECAARQGLD